MFDVFIHFLKLPTISNAVSSVSSAEYRLPGYPVIWRNFLVLEYPGNWFEYSVSQIFLILLEKTHMKSVFQNTEWILYFILIKKSIKS